MYAKQADVLIQHTCRAVSQLLGCKRCRPLPGPHQSAREQSAQGCKRQRLAAGRKQSWRQVTRAAAQQPVTRTKPQTRKQEEALKQDIVDPEVLDDLDEGSAFENARSPFSENGMYSEQHMGGHSDDEEQPEYERDYEYVQVEEDEDDPGALLAPGEAYHVIELSGCDFLIAVTEEGRLDLNDVFVEDFDQDMSARPEVLGELPEQPLLLQEIEWAAKDLGDTLKFKDPKTVVRKVYLVEITDTQPHQLNLERVWVLDSDTRTLARAQVEHRAKLDDPREWTLRILRDGTLAIDDTRWMPNPEDVVLDSEAEHKEAPSGDVEQVPLDPIEQMQEEEFYAPDNAESDNMDF